jgi:predicted transposase YdaD
MLRLHDIGETRVYQDAVEEGRKKGVKQELQRVLNETIPKMASLKTQISTIAEVFGVKISLVRKALAKNHS